MPRKLKAFQGLASIGYKDVIPFDAQNHVVIVATSRKRACQVYGEMTGRDMSYGYMRDYWGESESAFAKRALAFGREGVWIEPKTHRTEEIYEVTPES